MACAARHFRSLKPPEDGVNSMLIDANRHLGEAISNTKNFRLCSCGCFSPFFGAYPKVLDFLLVWNPKIQDVDMWQVCKGDGTCVL